MLEIPSNIVQQWIIPKDYVKPDIIAGRNYYLKWDDSSYGVSQKEVTDLKDILNDLSKFISSILYETAKQIHVTLESDTPASAKHIEEAFWPQLLLSRKRGNITYSFQIKADGTTIIVRDEKIVLVEKDDDGGDDNNGYNGITKKKTHICVSWILGELLFNRQKMQERR